MAASPVPSVAANDTAPETIAARYDVQAVLGQGGMGTVYRVRDRADGQSYALKYLRIGRGSRQTLLSSFEREYATLARLSHPCIIQVYDYFNDGETAFYTMELLEGTHAGALSPRPYREVCRQLRDVATSLALLHTRRLLHRDLSPRNVHISSDGQCKLIDFGALIGFDEAASVIGTPPCVPPEALDNEGLDQRADLYALGTLAYHMLTGRHAYPASHVGQLPSYWAQPVTPPSAAKPERAASGEELPAIPAALDELVMWLMRRDRSARPSSAQVVIDRLNALLGDEPHNELGMAETHLRSAPLQGRDKELEQAERHVTQLLRGRGQSYFLQGSHGVGKTRLLAEIALRARLRSLAVVQVDAALHQRAYQTARAICLGLLRARPELRAELSARTAATLQAFLPARHDDRPQTGAALSLGPEPGARAPGADLSEDDARWHSRIHTAMHELVLHATAYEPIVLAVDNVDGCDRASGAFISALAQNARRQPLYVVATCQSEASAEASSACEVLRQHSTAATLRGLDEPAQGRMLEGLFGDVSNLPRLNQALHARTSGHPGESLELLRALLYTGELRYVQGGWSLPLEPATKLGPDLGQQSARDRIASLSEGARGLLSALGLYRGALTLEVCGALASEPERVQQLLSELVARGLLVHDLGVYTFTHERVRRALLDALSDTERVRLRQRIAELILSRSRLQVAEQLEAGAYLLEAGDPRGLPLLRAGAIEICKRNRADATCVPSLERALELCRSRPDARADLAVFLAALCTCAYLVDRRLDRHGPEFLTSFRSLLALDTMRRLRRFTGAWLSVLLGLGWAFVSYMRLPRRARPCDLITLVQLFVTGVVGLSGTAALCLDRRAVDAAAEWLEPLCGLGATSELTFAYDFCHGLSLMLQERLAETHAYWRGLEARIGAPGSLPHLSIEGRRLWEGGVQYVLGTLESFADDSRALERARALESSELDVNLLAAAQLRRMYHGFRGEAVEVARARAQVEAYALRLGSAWQAETFSAIVINYCASLSHDLVSTKVALDETEKLAVELPSLERYVLSSRAVHALVRGKPHDCIAFFEGLLAAEQPRDRVGSSASVGLLAEAYLQIGEPTRARRLCEERLQILSAEDAGYVHLVLPLQVSLLNALGALSEHAQAKQRVEGLIARHGANASPLALGTLHETAARLALLRKDVKAFTLHLKQVELAFCPLGDGALIGRYTNLTQLAGAEGEVNAKIATLRELRAFEATLAQIQDREQLARHIFAWLMQKCEGFRGFLIAQEYGQLVPLLSTDGSEPSSEILEMVKRGLGSLMQDAVTTHLPEQDTHVERPALRRDMQGKAHEATHLHLLSFVDGSQFFGEGALVLRGPPGKPPRIRYDLLQAAARHLLRLRPRGSQRTPANDTQDSEPGRSVRFS